MTTSRPSAEPTLDNAAQVIPPPPEVKKYEKGSTARMMVVFAKTPNNRIIAIESGAAKLSNSIENKLSFELDHALGRVDLNLKQLATNTRNSTAVDMHKVYLGQYNDYNGIAKKVREERNALNEQIDTFLKKEKKPAIDEILKAINENKPKEEINKLIEQLEKKSRAFLTEASSLTEREKNISQRLKELESNLVVTMQATNTPIPMPPSNLVTPGPGNL